MTRAEFDEQIRNGDWADLINFCNENGYDYYFTNDIYSSAARDDRIDDIIEDMLRYDGWSDIRDYLNGLNDYDYDYWLHDEYGEWIEADDDLFCDRVDALLAQLEEDGFFEDSESNIDDESETESSITIMDLFTV